MSSEKQDLKPSYESEQPFLEIGMDTKNDDFSKTERRLKTANVLLIATDFFLLILIILTAVYAFGVPDRPEAAANLCLPCSDLKHHPDDKLKGIKAVDNETKCCLEANEDAGVLIGYFAQTWMKKHIAEENKRMERYECVNRTVQKPLIKLVGLATQQPENRHRLRWDGKHHLSINSDGISHHHEHGLIEIKVPGLYQIYSQVVLEHDLQHHDSNVRQYPSFHHSVVLIPNGMTHEEGERTILKNCNTYCKSNCDKQHLTSFINGAFQLLEGDRIAVKLSNTSELAKEPHKNVFGAYKL